jgi:hypothetical protein
VIHDTQYDGAQASVNRPVLIATLYDNAPGFIKTAQAARADWLAQNRELAARYCATTLRAMKSLRGDFALFRQRPTNTSKRHRPMNHCASFLHSLSGIRSGRIMADSPRTACSS